MTRNVLNSPRLSELKKRRRRAILNKILIFLLGFLIIFISLIYFSRIASLNIKEIQISGNKIIENQTLMDVAEQKISGKYLWAFPKSNVLIYPQTAIKNELQDKFKRIKSVDLSIKDNNILEISLAEREAKFTWCGAELPEALDKQAADQKCYFLDEDGYIFDEAPYFSGEVYFKLYGLNIENPLGAYFLKENFKELISFKNILVDMDLKPTLLYIINDEDAEIFLSREVSTGTTPRIIFKQNADFQKISENLKTALDTEPLKTKFKNHYSTLGT